jgi:hypothetical protein
MFQLSDKGTMQIKERKRYTVRQIISALMAAATGILIGSLLALSLVVVLWRSSLLQAIFYALPGLKP